MKSRVMSLVLVFLLVGACAGSKTRAVVLPGDRFKKSVLFSGWKFNIGFQNDLFELDARE